MPSKEDLCFEIATDVDKGDYGAAYRKLESFCLEYSTRQFHECVTSYDWMNDEQIARLLSEG